MKNPNKNKPNVVVGDVVRVYNIDSLYEEPDVYEPGEIDEFIGELGVVTEVDYEYDYPYSVKFDKKHIQNMSEDYGTLLWSDEEVELE